MLVEKKASKKFQIYKFEGFSVVLNVNEYSSGLKQVNAVLCVQLMDRLKSL